MKATRSVRAAFGVAETLLIGWVVAASCTQGPGVGTTDFAGHHAPSGPAQACQSDCDWDAAGWIREEHDRHRSVVSQYDDEPDRLREATILHTAILAEIEENRIACREACAGTRSGGAESP